MIKNLNSLIIIDLLIPNYDEGKLFDINIATRPGLTIWPYFKEFLNKKSLDIVTLNDFIKYKYYELKVPFYGISYEGYSSTISAFIKYDIEFSIIYSGEPSKNAPWFYLNFNKKVKHFNYVLAFMGYSSFLKNKSTIFLNFYWPNSFSNLEKYNKFFFDINDYTKLKEICFVTSPKSRIPVNYYKFISRLIKIPRYYLYELVYAFFPIMKSVDLYKFRLHIIKFFLSNEDFHLFGNDWDQFIKYNRDFKNIKIANKIKPCKDKLETIKEFKFCFCIENTDFEGYITEKIFDSLYANVIPIYLGTDKINEFIPKNCFINIKNFKSINELYSFLNNMEYNEWKNYISNINKFLTSKNFQRFNNEYFSEYLYNVIINKKINV